MSRETVIALRRFTTKLANSPTMSADPSGAYAPGAGIAPKTLSGNYSSLKPDTRQNLLTPDEKLDLNNPNAGRSATTTSDTPLMKTDEGLAPFISARDDGTPAGDAANALAESRLNRGFLQKIMENDPDTINYLMQVGGGIGLGGLGAYGLAQLLQSREDEEKKRFPWLATLAGMGVGGLAAPYLMNNPYVQQAGSAVGNAAMQAGGAVRDAAGSAYNAARGALS